MNFEEILPILKKNPNLFAYRTSPNAPHWRSFGMRIRDNMLLEFELAEPEESRYIDLHSEDILADDWEIG